MVLDEQQALLTLSQAPVGADPIVVPPTLQPESQRLDIAIRLGVRRSQWLGILRSPWCAQKPMEMEGVT